MKTLLKLCFALTVLVFILVKAGPSKVLADFSQFKVSAILLVNLTTLAGFFLGASSIIVLGRSMSPGLGWLPGLHGFLATTSLSLFAPGRIGDLALPLFWKSHMDPAQSLAVVFLDKVNSFFWTLLAGAIGIYVVFESLWGFALTVAGTAFPALAPLLYTRCAFLLNRFPRKIAFFLEQLVAVLRTATSEGHRQILFAFFISGLRILVGGIGFWVSLWGVGLGAPVVYSICVMAVAQFISMVPVSIMGIGTVEAVCLLGLARIHVESSPVIAALIVGRLITLFWLSTFFLTVPIKTVKKNEAANGP